MRTHILIWGDILLYEIRLKHYKNFSGPLCISIPQYAILLGGCGSGKSNLGQALFKIREHYEQPVFSLCPEDFSALCEENKIEFEYRFFLEGHRLFYRLLFSSTEKAPRQIVQIDGQSVFTGAGKSICEIVQALAPDYGYLALRWKAFVGGMCFIGGPEKPDGASFLTVDNFAAHLSEQSVGRAALDLFHCSPQVLLLTSRLAALDLTILPAQQILLLQNNTVKPLPEWTDKRIEPCHNLRKLYKSGAFLCKP